MAFDPDLMRRYDGRGPRYTSYPTALQFTSGFTEADYLRLARESNQEPVPRDLSLYFHLPFCNEACWYCACHRAITRREDRKQRYLDHLHQAIARQARLFDDDRPVRQIHLGGGTPTVHAVGELAELIERVGEHFHFADPGQREFAIEIDPRTVSPEDVSELAAIGFNRFSLGVQDFDPRVQAAINRHQSVEQVAELVRAARRSGVESVSFDLIYGLPHQSLDGFRESLEAVAEIGPDRLSVYAYAHLPERFPVQKLIPSEALPGPESRLQLFASAVEVLTSRGYEHIGMDHFALAGDDLVRARDEDRLHRNFQGYSTQPDCDLVGMGASAISGIGDSHAQTDPDIARWQAAVAEDRIPVCKGIELDRDDRIRRDVIQAIMCRGLLDMAEVERRHGIRFGDYFADTVAPLNQMVDDGLVRIDGQKLRVTPTGRFLVRSVARLFDAYNGSDSRRFSRVI